jgi:hypothetical protein
MLVNILREPRVQMENLIEFNQSIITFNDLIINVDPDLINYFI